MIRLKVNFLPFSHAILVKIGRLSGFLAVYPGKLDGNLYHVIRGFRKVAD